MLDDPLEFLEAELDNILRRLFEERSKVKNEELIELQSFFHEMIGTHKLKSLFQWFLDAYRNKLKNYVGELPEGLESILESSQHYSRKILILLYVSNLLSEEENFKEKLEEFVRSMSHYLIARFDVSVASKIEEIFSKNKLYNVYKELVTSYPFILIKQPETVNQKLTKLLEIVGDLELASVEIQRFPDIIFTEKETSDFYFRLLTESMKIFEEYEETEKGIVNKDPKLILSKMIYFYPTFWNVIKNRRLIEKICRDQTSDIIRVGFALYSRIMKQTLSKYVSTYGFEGFTLEYRQIQGKTLKRVEENAVISC